ncbi:hypothetical protein KI387_016883, partial [Taxus chinensis]
MRTAQISRRRELQFGTSGTEGCRRREQPEEPRANHITPRVIGRLGIRKPIS